jgi:hypothetical protein
MKEGKKERRKDGKTLRAARISILEALQVDSHGSSTSKRTDRRISEGRVSAFARVEALPSTAKPRKQMAILLDDVLNYEWAVRIIRIEREMQGLFNSDDGISKFCEWAEDTLVGLNASAYQEPKPAKEGESETRKEG